ncbi:MAG: S-methyl-5-thioribose-1-phosphate isomerase [Gammaproteobacteria bacterium]|nr:S-methyl-5-thioribose-1-phosphate isomerase [Gammaproteobacteria bacterium]
MVYTSHDTIRAVEWLDGKLVLLDQRLLPRREVTLSFTEVEPVGDAIRDMVVRGAPAIGVTAAYGVVLACREAYARSHDGWLNKVEPSLLRLASARPTAVNLIWAIDRMRIRMKSLEGDPVPGLLEEARRIHGEDIAANRLMGKLGAELITDPCNVITHCNAGALATGGYGTALGVIRSAFAAGKVDLVYADETRPWLQGARLTAWELVKDGIPVTLITDGAAAHLMKQGRIGWAIVGSDRIAANGDVANKIGTYGLAVSARYHGIGLMVVAPSSTVDMELADGSQIPIEEREPQEIFSFAGQRVAAEGADASNPVFDVTPRELVDAIVTERGVVMNPNREKMAKMMKNVQKNT